MFTVDVESTIGDVVVETTQNKGLSPEYWTERIVNKIVSVSDNADPMVQAQAKAFKDAVMSGRNSYLAGRMKKSFFDNTIPFGSSSLPSK